MEEEEEEEEKQKEKERSTQAGNRRAAAKLCAWASLTTESSRKMDYTDPIPPYDHCRKTGQRPLESHQACACLPQHCQGEREERAGGRQPGWLSVKVFKEIMACIKTFTPLKGLKIFPGALESDWRYIIPHLR